jgi:hypothetical protein
MNDPRKLILWLRLLMLASVALIVVLSIILLNTK